MAQVPVYQSQRRLDPTDVNPKVAATVGNEIVDVGQGLKGLGQRIQKLDDQRQTLKAQTALAKNHMQIRNMAATDPNLDNLDERVDQKSEEAVNQASELIKSTEARNNFVAKANLDIERRNVPIYNTILKRKSQDFKNELVQANDADIQEYQGLADPEERNLIRQKILDRTNQAVNDGHINADWAKAHATTLLKSADLNQVKSDMAINATHTYEELQKGKEGLYPYLNEGQRKKFADTAQKLITKQGSDNKLIYGIAQNHAENTLIDKMANNQLTQDDVNNAQLMGVNGIRVRPEFAKAATEALQDPFPTESVPEKYNKLMAKIQDTDTDLVEAKMDVLTARGITPQQKAHLLNAHLREDPQEGKQSVNSLIQSGIKNNKQAIMEANKNLNAEIKDRQSFFRQVTQMFTGHVKDDQHLADLQKKYMEKIQTSKSMDDRLQAANEVMNQDTLSRNPSIANSVEKGTLRVNRITGEKRIYFSNGKWKPATTD